MASSSSHARQPSNASSTASSSQRPMPTSPRRPAVPASPSSPNVLRPAYSSRRSKARVPALLILDSNLPSSSTTTSGRAAAPEMIEMDEGPAASANVLFEAQEEAQERKKGAKRRSGELARSVEEEEEETLEQLGYDAPTLRGAGYGAQRTPEPNVESAAWSIPLSSAAASARSLEEGLLHQAGHGKLDFEPMTRREKAWMWSSAVVVLLLFAVAISISKDWIDWPGDGIGKL